MTAGPGRVNLATLADRLDGARAALDHLDAHPEDVPAKARAAIERRGRVAALTEAADAFCATGTAWAMGVSAWLLERAEREGDPS